MTISLGSLMKEVVVLWSTAHGLSIVNKCKQKYHLQMRICVDLMLQVPLWCKEEFPDPCGNREKFYLGGLPYLTRTQSLILEVWKIKLLSVCLNHFELISSKAEEQESLESRYLLRHRQMFCSCFLSGSVHNLFFCSRCCAVSLLDSTCSVHIIPHHLHRKQAVLEVSTWQCQSK